MHICALESSESWLISGVTTVEIGKLFSVLREFRRVFFERLWGGMHGCLRSAEDPRPFSFQSLSNKSIKSIANYRNQSKSIITKTRVIDFYRFLIVIDVLVSITFDFY